MRFGLNNGTPLSLNKVGFALGISKERVRQIIAKARAKLCAPEQRRTLEGLEE